MLKSLSFKSKSVESEETEDNHVEFITTDEYNMTSGLWLRIDVTELYKRYYNGRKTAEETFVDVHLHTPSMLPGSKIHRSRALLKIAKMLAKKKYILPIDNFTFKPIDNKLHVELSFLESENETILSNSLFIAPCFPTMIIDLPVDMISLGLAGSSRKGIPNLPAHLSIDKPMRHIRAYEFKGLPL